MHKTFGRIWSDGRVWWPALALSVITAGFGVPEARAQSIAPIQTTTLTTGMPTGTYDVRGTFGSHNQRVVSNAYGIFVVFGREIEVFSSALEMKWHLKRSVDGGLTFSTVYSSPVKYLTSPPVLETDEYGRLYVMHSDAAGDGAAEFYRFTPDDGFTTPLRTRIADVGTAQKYTLLYDRFRQRLYYAANQTFVMKFAIIELNGVLTALGGGRANPYTWTSAVTHCPTGPPDLGVYPCRELDAHYPYLTLDRNGTLFGAWTTTASGFLEYWTIHAVKSTDGGLNWQTLTSSALSLPIPATSVTRIDRPVGIEATKMYYRWDSTWLQSMLARDGKLHFSYSAVGASDPDTMNYERFNAVTGVNDFHISPPSTWSGATLTVTPALPGFFVSHRNPAVSTIYTVQMQRLSVNDSRIVILASDDNGATWYDRAISDAIGMVPSCTTIAPRCEGIDGIGGWPLVTDDGYIVGVLTTMDAAKHVMFFRAKVADPSFGAPNPDPNVDPDPRGTTWTYPGNFGGWAPQALDANGDNRGDLGLTANHASGWTTWMARGETSGTFDGGTSWGVSGNYSGYTAGKPIRINNDLRDDIWLTLNDGTKWSVYYALSATNGLPGTVVNWQHLANYAGMTPGSGDFDNDGDTDLVLTEPGATSWKARVAKWNGTSFDAPLSWSEPGSWGGWTSMIGNFAGSGASDLALVYNDNVSWRAWVATANGTPTLFNAATYWEYPTNFAAWMRSSGDFNGDGLTDLILHYNDAGSMRTWVAFSAGNGAFYAPVNWLFYGAFNNLTTHLGDVNADGKTDLILSQNDTRGWRVWVATATGYGGFSDPISWSIPQGDYSGFALRVDDINGDDKADLILHRADAVAWKAYIVLSLIP